MKILISEEQHRFLTEANKVDVLVNKIGFTKGDAEILEQSCGGISVWIGKKIFDHIVNRHMSTDRVERGDAIQSAKRFISAGNAISIFRNEINSIMDWFRVGLNGNIRQYENEPFSSLYRLSKEWHDSLGVGEGDINYNEENEVIRDYREDGIGLYWVNLETNNSPEECERMGHCGRTNSNNTIYSLRETKRLNPKYTLNKSHLTAAVGNDNVLYQMKGPKNSKPQEKFYPYIIDLLLNDDTIQSFGSEYDSASDFNLVDLNEEQIKKIYEQKPGLFEGRKGKRALRKIGLIKEKDKNEMWFELEMSTSDVRYYVDGDWDVRKYKDQSGRQRSVGMFETLLSGDYWDLFDHGGEWESGLEYYIDEENTQIIWDMLKGITNEDDIEGLSLKEVINQYDNDYEIRNALGNAMSSVQSDAYYVYYKGALKTALEEYGEVTKMNDEGVVLKINLQNIIDAAGLNEDEVDDFFEKCDDDNDCVFRELLGDYYDKPDFRIDDRWYPDINENYFNEVLNDYLGDVRL